MGFLLWLFLGVVAITGYRLDAAAHPLLWGVAVAPVVLLLAACVLVFVLAVVALLTPARPATRLLR